MAQRGRPGLSVQQKKDLWSRWRQGQSLSEIGRALGKQAGSIHGVLAANGGITPRDRKRGACALSLAEREEISRGLAEGLFVRVIAGRLQRAASTVSREIARNRGRAHYRAARADERAWAEARRPKSCLLAKNAALRKLVAEKLQEDWSPEQIAGWLAATHDGDDAMRVSHETIYRSLYLQTRRVLHRRRCPGVDLLHHSDQGSTYAAEDYQDVLGAHGITCSMSRRGEVLDNAAMESWNSTFKFECGERFETNEIAESKAFDYIEVFYNRQRRHSAIGYVSPAEFERAFTERQAA